MDCGPLDDNLFLSNFKESLLPVNSLHRLGKLCRPTEPINLAAKLTQILGQLFIPFLIQNQSRVHQKLLFQFVPSILIAFPQPLNKNRQTRNVRRGKTVRERGFFEDFER